MAAVAQWLNKVTKGRLSPSAVTMIGLIGHLPIVWLITRGYLWLAGLWLIVFGLFDALDGELARLQNRATPTGMFLDSVSDRLKELLLYGAIGNYMINNIYPWDCTSLTNCYLNTTVPRAGEGFLVVLIIAALGGSMLTSYINAWGETVLARAGVTREAINKTFRGGLASFDVRMVILIIGLLTGLLSPALILLVGLVGFTILSRLSSVFQELRRVSD